MKSILISVLVASGLMAGVVTDLTPPDTSLEKIPISYFGGVNCKERSQKNIEMLAKMRLIVIEKWEGPCWYECYTNLTMKPPVPCQPSCGADDYQLNTLTRAKKVNPKLAAVFYLNTLYDFPFLKLHGKFQNAKADVVDIKGNLVAFKNDNGMPNINVFDFSKQQGVDLWTGFIKNLTDTGYVDGVFDDKHNIFSMYNESGSFWQICEWGTGKNTWNVSCGIISEETAKSYNTGKQKVLDFLYDHFGKSAVVFFNSTHMGHLKSGKGGSSPTSLAKEIQDALKNYTYIHIQTKDLINGDCTSVQSSCSTDDIATFLLALEKGAFLGCNGWDDQFDKPLGEPMGPAEKTGNKLERHFKSGTYVTWDLTSNKGIIFWSNSTKV